MAKQWNSKTSDPFFVVGSPRSGTTFLRGVLTSHEDIIVLNEPSSFRQIGSLFASIQSAGKLSNSSVVGAARSYFQSVIQDELVLSGKTIIGVKDPHLSFQMDVLAKTFPEAKFVHLLRDGRDVALSVLTERYSNPCSAFKKMENSVQASLEMWACHVKAARKYGAQLGHKRFFEVRYEDLARDPIRQANKILRFLCAQRSKAMEMRAKDFVLRKRRDPNDIFHRVSLGDKDMARLLRESNYDL